MILGPMLFHQIANIFFIYWNKLMEKLLCRNNYRAGSTNYPLKFILKMKWIWQSKVKRYERDCSPWKHISQRATKHEKRSIQSFVDHHRWTSLHEKKRKEVNHYYIVISKCCVKEEKKVEKVNVEKSIGHFVLDAFFNDSFEGT